jgi:hypothetical protein
LLLASQAGVLGCTLACIQHCLSNLFIEYNDKFPRPWEDIPNSGGKRFREGDVHFPLGYGDTTYSCSSSLLAGEIVLLSFDKSDVDIHKSFHRIFI